MAILVYVSAWLNNNTYGTIDIIPNIYDGTMHLITVSGWMSTGENRISEHTQRGTKPSLVCIYHKFKCSELC